jgi:hypothetical protein
MVPTVDLIDRLRHLERNGEEIVTVASVTTGEFLVVTRLVNPNVTRLAAVTHAARLGADSDPLLHSFLGDHIVVDEVAE